MNQKLSLVAHSILVVLCPNNFSSQHRTLTAGLYLFIASVPGGHSIIFSSIVTTLYLNYTLA
jgi:hypothetical protein